jgi:polyisoprenoid-binding protein YceI
MIDPMALETGTHKLGPDSGKLEVRTYRDGIAQKVGHDLILDVGTWEGTVEVNGDGHPSSVVLEADAGSLQVREGVRGVKPLSENDKGDIRTNIDEKILLRQPISFRSTAVETAGGVTVRGELTIVGHQRPESFELELSDQGRLTGTLPVVQSEFGIKPYKAMMGALKVKDAVEIVLDVQLPVG